MQVQNSPSFGQKIVILDDKSNNPVYVKRSKDRDEYRYNHNHNYVHNSGPILPALVGGIATWYLSKATLTHLADKAKEVPELVKNVANKLEKSVTPETVEKFVKHKKLASFISALTVFSAIKGLTNTKVYTSNNNYCNRR